MPNPIKYSASAQTLALKKGNFWIGTGDSDKGPTQTTDYWNGITPPTGGYSVYVSRPSNGPAVYNPASDSELIVVTRNLSGTVFATGPSALNWYASQTNYMCMNIDYPVTITDSLSLNVDAGFTPSYPRSNTTWYDVSTNGNNGTLTNGPAWSSPNNGYLLFDGVDDYASIPNSSSVNITSAITLEAWIYPIKNAAIQNVICKSSISQNNGYIYPRCDNGWSRSIFYLNVSGSWSTLSSTWPAVNTWIYTSATYDGTQMKIYINGVLTASKSQSGAISSNTNNLTLGNQPGYSEYFGGRIGLARVYSKALSAAEVLQNYQGMLTRFIGANIVTNGMILYLDGGYTTSYPGSGTAWTNVAGITGGNGTLTNGPVYSASGGGSISFDGVDDYTNITGNEINVKNAFTLSAWIYPRSVSSWAGIMTKGRDIGPWYGIWISPGGAPVCANNGANFTSSTAMTINNWWNVVGTFNGSTVTIYLNGQNTGSGSSSAMASEPASNFVIARALGVSEFMYGYVAVSQVYNRALSATEVLQNYNSQKSRFGL